MLKLYKKLKLKIYDFDGIMTNNKVLIDVFNNEYVQVNRSDGLAISEIKKMKRTQKFKLNCPYKTNLDSA